MLTHLAIASGLLCEQVVSQSEMRLFLSLNPKQPGSAYNPVTNPDRFSGPDDMNRICQDDGASIFSDPAQSTWEFLSLSCSPSLMGASLRTVFPSFPNVPLVNEDGQVVAPTFEQYFEGPNGTPDGPNCAQTPAEAPTAGNPSGCWDPVENPLEANLARIMRTPADCAATVNGVAGPPPGAICANSDYTGSEASLSVVTAGRYRRYFWNACDAQGNLEDQNLDQADVTCNNWRSSTGSGYVQDIGVLQPPQVPAGTGGTGAPGHRTGSVGCDSDFVHIMCLQVIGVTAVPVNLEPPILIFKTNCRIWDDGNALRIVDPLVNPTTAAQDAANPGNCPDPPSTLTGVDLMDWLCNNDPLATPNLVQPPCTGTGANGPPSCVGGSGAGCSCSDAIQTHGPYQAIICTNPNPTIDPNDPNPRTLSRPVDKNRFLETGSTRDIFRYHPPALCSDVGNTLPCCDPVNDPEGCNYLNPFPVSERLQVADDYASFFNAQGCTEAECTAGTCQPLYNDPINAAGIAATNPLSDPTVATGCGANGMFDGSGDCNSFLGGRPFDQDPYQTRHWDAGTTCGQLPATQDCTSDRQLPLLCIEFDKPIGVIRGDPHFVSFSGGKYDVHGFAGGIYNIISDKHFQFNSLFVAGSRTYTYMGAVGLMFNGHTIWWQASLNNKTRNEKVLVDGQMLKKNQELSLMDGTLYSVTFTKKNAAAPPRLDVRVPGYMLKFTYKHAPRRQYGLNMYASNQYRPHYFDFSVVRTFERNHEFHTHGLLGQTARMHTPVKPIKKTWQGEGVIEGTVEDYRVNETFGMGFKFNQFDSQFHWKSA